MVELMEMATVGFHMQTRQAGNSFNQPIEPMHATWNKTHPAGKIGWVHCSADAAQDRRVVAMAALG